MATGKSALGSRLGVRAVLPLAFEDRVDDGVAPLPGLLDVHPDTALFDHAGLQHRPRRRLVVRCAGAPDPVKLQVLEGEPEQVDGLDALAQSPGVGAQGEAAQAAERVEESAGLNTAAESGSRHEARRCTTVLRIFSRRDRRDCALTVGQQQSCRSLDECKGFAVDQRWCVGGRAFTDHFGAGDPQTRPGWGLVRRQIRAGFADGVVVLTQSITSPHLEEYEQQLTWFETHLGFIALVTPEQPHRSTTGRAQVRRAPRDRPDRCDRPPPTRARETPLGRTPMTTTAHTPAPPMAGEGAVLGFKASFLPGKRRTGEMRRLTATHLRLWGLELLADDVTLAVSELVTNAVQHGDGSPVELQVTRGAHELRVEVTDDNPEPACSPSPSDLVENGRGLLLVAALAQQWDVSNDGRTTWCRFRLPAGRAT